MMTSLNIIRNTIRHTTRLNEACFYGNNIINKTLNQNCKCIYPIVLTTQQSRCYRPNSKLPKRYQIQKNRYKELRDDVYFLTDQALPRHNITDAINCIRAYDLFGPEKIDLLLKVNLGEGRDKIGALKGLLNLPYPVNPAQRVLVFAEGELAERAKEAGADIVGGLELIKPVEAGEVEFDHCLCTIDFLPNIKHLPKILRNKMPNTRRGTATNDIVEALEKYTQGESYNADNSGNIRQTLGKTNFTNNQVEENVSKLLATVAGHSNLPLEKFFLSASLIIPSGPKVDLLVNDIIP